MDVQREWEALPSPEQRHEHGWGAEDGYPCSLATPIWLPRYFVPTANKLLMMVVLGLAEVLIFPQQPSKSCILHWSLERGTHNIPSVLATSKQHWYTISDVSEHFLPQIKGLAGKNLERDATRSADAKLTGGIFHTV